MQDVIFNGSGNRKPLARASVELIFDNSQGRAAGQWSQYAEISVRRVLQRDGESSYYINGTHVRRRDITDMFLGTGLGPRAYAIIEQGMISRVIEAKPEELRVFLEEAAGHLASTRSAGARPRTGSPTRARTWRASPTSASSSARSSRSSRRRPRSRRATRSTRPTCSSSSTCSGSCAAATPPPSASATRRRSPRRPTRWRPRTRELRSIESRVETARAAHYGAGDALNAAQGALYAANAEVAQHESELRHAEETRQRLESQHTERRAQLGAWREQRSQLTHALHMWAARSGDGEARTSLQKQAGAGNGNRAGCRRPSRRSAPRRSG